MKKADVKTIMLTRKQKEKLLLAPENNELTSWCGVSAKVSAGALDLISKRKILSKSMQTFVVQKSLLLHRFM